MSCAASVGQTRDTLPTERTSAKNAESSRVEATTVGARLQPHKRRWTLGGLVALCPRSPESDRLETRRRYGHAPDHPRSHHRSGDLRGSVDRSRDLTGQLVAAADETWMALAEPQWSLARTSPKREQGRRRARLRRLPPLGRLNAAALQLISNGNGGRCVSTAEPQERVGLQTRP